MNRDLQKNNIRDTIYAIVIALEIHEIKPQIVQLVALKPFLPIAPFVIFNRKIKIVHSFTGMEYLFSSSDRREKSLLQPVMWLLRFILSRKSHGH